MTHKQKKRTDKNCGGGLLLKTESAAKQGLFIAEYTEVKSR